MATTYEVIKAQNEHPIRELLQINDNGRIFSISLQPFGPGTFAQNTASMGQSYAHPATWAGGGKFHSDHPEHENPF